MKRLLPVVCSILLFTGFAIDDAKAQAGRESYGQNVIFAELFGPGMSLSFNYDFRFAKTNSGLGMRVGVGGFKFDDVNILSVPVGINYLLGNENKFFELGVNGIYSSRGFFFLNDDEGNDSKFVGMLTLGFRRQLPGKGFNFRVSLNPVVGMDDNDELFFWPFYGGVSLGYSF